MMARKYTEKVHAQRLIKVLESGDTCRKCPASPEYSQGPDGCEICLNFILPDCIDIPSCPCYSLGPQEAVKRSWIALEEKGYI
jgi:hypothetical protein